MFAWKMAVRAECLGVPLREAIDMAAHLGFLGIQFDAVGELSPQQLSRTGRRQLRHRITSRGMFLTALGIPTRHGYDEVEKLEARVELTRQALLMASELGAPVVINHLGQIPADPTAPSALPLLESMARIGAESERVGARFSIRVAQENPAELAKFLQTHDRHGLGVALDPANLLVRGVDLRAGMEILHDRLTAVLLKDATRSVAAISGFRETPIGQGEMNWPVFLQNLRDVEYHGFLTLDRETGFCDSADCQYVLRNFGGQTL